MSLQIDLASPVAATLFLGLFMAKIPGRETEKRAHDMIENEIVDIYAITITPLSSKVGPNQSRLTEVV